MSPRFKGGHHAGSTCNPFCFQLEEVAELYAICKAGAELPNESSVYAEEGTAAHALGEYKLRKYLHERVKRPTSEYEDEEMEANTDIYAEFIISTVERIKETCPHPLVMVEERLDYSYLVPQGFGTGDCVIIADGTLYVMDYKNGKGVFVNCDHNPQMMLYAWVLTMPTDICTASKRCP